MRSSTVFAAASLALTALAAPVEKRDQLVVVYATTTTEVLETVWTTVWEDEATPSPVAEFYETHVAVTTVAPIIMLSAPAAIAQVASPTAVAVAVAQVAANTPAAPVVQSSTSTSTPAPAPVPTTSTVVQAPAPAPTTSSVTQAPAPVVAAPVSSVVATVASSAAVQSAAAPVSSSGSSSVSYPNTGDITYYDVSVGLSSCGLQGQNSQDLVALSPALMANGANPNTNPKCGTKIEISYGGNTHMATVFDTCPGCSGGSIDLTQELFQKVAPNGDGRVSGVSWRFVS